MFVKHRDSNSRLYRIWTNMKTRCFNVNSPKYKVYGAKGITVCNDWRFNYSEFKNWALKNGYSDKWNQNRA